MQQLELRSRDQDSELDAVVRRWLDEVPDDVDPVLLRRMQLVLATADTAAGRVEQGARTMREIREWAAERQESYLQARSEYVLAVLLRRAGEVTSALEHAVASVDLLPDDQPAAVRSDHLLGLADALAVSGTPDAAIDRYWEALRLAELADDARLRFLVLNNLAYTFYEAERFSEAAGLCERMQAIARSHGRPLPLHALDTVALTYVAIGRLDDAERLFSTVDLAAAVPVDQAESLLTLAGVRRERGDLAAAREALNRCDEVTRRHALGSVGVKAMRERAELSAAEGRFDEAFEQFKLFHERLLAQHAAERDARARMLHAIFEASEARRQSERFRRLSYRDALTQLRNRRYVDEHLGGLIESSLELDQPLSLAFIDLDHFKQVNDTCSHEVGDEVLRRVAAVLDRYAPVDSHAVAARMGGEEFLLVLPGADQVEAARLLDALRADVQAIDWRGATHGLPVTVSIGTATGPVDGKERLQLLGTADRRLYAAKNSGRNRVACVG
ncbi:MAG TPA: diguanylate cyclase [Actinomycetales bacterium]|nr:diguanylate cyclase [Actinomycetales bacterium]